MRRGGGSARKRAVKETGGQGNGQAETGRFGKTMQNRALRGRSDAYTVRLPPLRLGA